MSIVAMYYKLLGVLYLLITLVCVVGMLFVDDIQDYMTLSAIAAVAFALFVPYDEHNRRMEEEK